MLLSIHSSLHGDTFTDAVEVEISFVEENKEPKKNARPVDGLGCSVSYCVVLKGPLSFVFL